MKTIIIVCLFFYRFQAFADIKSYYTQVYKAEDSIMSENYIIAKSLLASELQKPA